jgi:hypothetical protein
MLLCADESDSNIFQHGNAFGFGVCVESVAAILGAKDPSDHAHYSIFSLLFGTNVDEHNSGTINGKDESQYTGQPDLAVRGSAANTYR